MATALKLDFSTEPEFDLGDAPPAGWVPEHAYSVELTYQCNGEQIEFAYRDSPVLPTAPSGLLTIADVEGDFKPLIIPGAQNQLDLKVSKNCIVVVRMAEDKELYWSTNPRPILTKGQAREDTYFGLRLIDRGVPYKPADFPIGRLCKQISFCARMLVGVPEERHAFSINVLARSCRAGGNLELVHIDPDIRNPTQA